MLTVSSYLSCIRHFPSLKHAYNIANLPKPRRDAVISYFDCGVIAGQHDEAFIPRSGFKSLPNFKRTSTILLTSQSRLVMPAAIAGLVRSVLWMRTKVVVRREYQRDRMCVVF